VRVSQYYRAVEHLSPALPDRERVQDQAAAILFLTVTGHWTWDRRLDIGPKTRTRAEIDREMAKRDELAALLETCVEGYRQLGDWPTVITISEIAARSRKTTEALRFNPRNPWQVQRKSQRTGDEWMHGFIIQATLTCLQLFNEKMQGTVATLTNVGFGRQDVTRGAVQGVVKRLP
jgi:hypothetical protein